MQPPPWLRRAGFLLFFLCACSAPPPPSTPDASVDLDAEAGAPDADAEADSRVRAPDASPPCECDDGLYCNGAEDCDDGGICIAGVAPEPIDDGDPCTIPTTCNEDTGAFDTVLDRANPICGFVNDQPRITPQDYGFAYWPGNHRPTETWPVVEPVRHFLTGYYGLAFDEAAGALHRFGALHDALPLTTATRRPNADLDTMMPASLVFEAGHGSTRVTATQFRGEGGDAVHHGRMIDGGRFMNRIYVPQVSYAADARYQGEVQISSMPRHIVFTHTARSDAWTGAASPSVRIRLGGDALAPFDTIEWLEMNRALRVTNAMGDGWVFVAYDQAGTTTRLTRSAAGEVTLERSATTPPASGELAVSLVAIPTHAMTETELAVYLQSASPVRISYTLMDREGAALGEPISVPWDEELGAYRVSLRSLQEAGAPRWPDYETAAYHNWYGRHRIQVVTSGDANVSVPLAFFGSGQVSWYITGGVALLRDEGGEPLGVPLQISKNWHEPGNPWYHFYTQPTFSGGRTDTMEFTVASSRWGAAYAASHAQLSLVGWSAAGGHWDESALGVFGESVTYDPDVNLQRAMMDDVRPFLVQADRKWNWTGNVGGADFLRYRTAAEPYWERRLARVRSRYDAVGPNVTDVTYSGVSTDGRIQGEVRAQLAATDDLVRVYLHFDYTFLEDVSYDRLAFFQVAADRYGDNDFARFAYGNADRVTFDGATPAHRTTGYAADTDRGILLEGDAPWVMLYQNRVMGDRLPERFANVGFVVRHYEARVGDAVLTSPYINIHRTHNRYSQMAFEVGIPHDEGAALCGAPCMGRRRFVPAGSTVQFTLEYLVPPADKDRYYGESPYLLALPAAAYSSTTMMQTLARGNTLRAEATIGTIEQTYPLEVDVADGPTAADLTLNGGLGYTPISFRGLSRHDGWRLERESEGGTWARVDQAVWGNDYWQTAYIPGSETYTLTFSVSNTEPTRYRLVWVRPE